MHRIRKKNAISITINPTEEQTVETIKVVFDPDPDPTLVEVVAYRRMYKKLYEADFRALEGLGSLGDSVISFFSFFL